MARDSRTPMFDLEQLKAIKRQLPEFTQEQTTQIEGNSAEYAKEYLRKAITFLENKIKTNVVTSEDGDVDFRHDSEEIERIQEALEIYRTDLAELETSECLKDRGKELAYAKDGYKLINKISPLQIRYHKNP